MHRNIKYILTFIFACNALKKKRFSSLLIFACLFVCFFNLKFLWVNDHNEAILSRHGM